MSVHNDNAPVGPQLASETPQQGPLAFFDSHLQILSDSYLSFFNERKKIEEYYVDALIKLHRRSQAMDGGLDDAREISTTRSAWQEVRDNIEREAQARSAFLRTLTVDVLNPLVALKETQERTRKRIKDDLKESSQTYNEYAETTLPKLKRAYIKKCQEAEDQKGAPQPMILSPVPSLDSQDPLVESKTNPGLPFKAVMASPHPSRPADRRTSGSVPSSRPRSPTASTPFSEFANHGKKQLNQLMTTLLDKGKEGGRSENALRAVKLKREAEEADKEYRKGIYWMETLRLKRMKTLENGYKSLEMFVQEASSTLKRVLEKYTDNMTATTTTQTQLAGHTRSAVKKINPRRDASAIAAKVARVLPSEIPSPILYHNYHVGECKDFIFGVSLVDYATARNLPDGEVPKIVRLCINEIDQRGLKSEGIYRVSGRHAIVQELQQRIEFDEAAFEFNPHTDDVTAVSSLLKLYLRELPEPVFRFPVQDRIQHTEDRAEHESNNFTLLRSKIRRLPTVHQATLKALVEHLARVVVHSENKMDIKNLAIVFGGAIFGEDDLPKGQSLLSVQSWKDSLMEDLINNASILFDDRASAALPQTDRSPPLPPAPAGEPVPEIAYGSSHTKFATISPPDSSRGESDFQPPLPPRPANSIHPSLRTSHASAMGERSDGILPAFSPTLATPSEALQSEVASAAEHGTTETPSTFQPSPDQDLEFEKVVTTATERTEP